MGMVILAEPGALEAGGPEAGEVRAVGTGGH